MPSGPEGGRHQPVVEHAAEAVTEEGADDLVDRRPDLGEDEHDPEHDQGHGEVGPRLQTADEEARRDGQRGRHQGADEEEQPPRRGEAGHGSGERGEELGGGTLAQSGQAHTGQPDPRRTSGHAVTLGDPADTPSNPFAWPCVLEA